MNFRDVLRFKTDRRWETIGLPRIAKYSAIFQYKIIIFQEQFHYLCIFNRKFKRKLAFILQFDVGAPLAQVEGQGFDFFKDLRPKMAENRSHLVPDEANWPYFHESSDNPELGGGNYTRECVVVLN